MTVNDCSIQFKQRDSSWEGQFSSPVTNNKQPHTHKPSSLSVSAGSDPQGQQVTSSWPSTAAYRRKETKNWLWCTAQQLHCEKFLQTTWDGASSTGSLLTWSFFSTCWHHWLSVSYRCEDTPAYCQREREAAVLFDKITFSGRTKYHETRWKQIHDQQNVGMFTFCFVWWSICRVSFMWIMGFCPYFIFKRTFHDKPRLLSIQCFKGQNGKMCFQLD